MRHLKLFEKWGISSDIEEQARYFIERMATEKKDKYSFIYHNKLGNYCFLILIDKFSNKDQRGCLQYDVVNNNRVNNLRISLTRNDDYPTLLHELKHMDRLLRIGVDKDPVTKAHQWAKKADSEKKINKKILSLFYLLNKDEFEAKYHGYYTYLDEYIAKIKSENPDVHLSSDDVVRAVTKFLTKINDDFSYTWWTGKYKINLLKLESKSNLIKIFNGFIKGSIDDVSFPTLTLNIDPRITISMIGKFIKNKLGILDKVDEKNFDKVKTILENELNRNKFRFNRKFRRLYAIMVEKYAG